MKLELHITYGKIIEPKENEYVYYVGYDGGDEFISPNEATSPVKICIGRTEYFETENPVILDFIKWADEEWVPFIHKYTHHNKAIPEEKFNEWDEICSAFEKAITAETGYNFTTIENEYTDEPTINAVLVNDSIYWEY